MDRPGPLASGRGRAARPAGATHRYHQLREEILEFDLRPGEALDEGELAERFGRSRTAVREALLNLSTERLVDAIEARDPEAAESAARSHSAHFRDRTAHDLAGAGGPEVRVDPADAFCDH